MGVCQITHPQASQLVTHLERAGLTPELAAKVVEDRGRSLAPAMVEAAKPCFVTPLFDDEVPGPFTQYLEPWYRMAFDEFDRYRGPVAYRVKAGCRLAEDCPRLGPCYGNWDQLQTADWRLKNDEPTKESVVFFVPRIVPGSTAMEVNKQAVLLGFLREKHGLPSHHLASFGSAALDAALILRHFKRTGERVPFHRYWVRTDTLRAVGRRLCLGSFDGGGLGGGDWYWDDAMGVNTLGCFPLGVEAR